MTIDRWLAHGELDLPLPGGGCTQQRWSRLAALAEIDLVAGRLAEAHTDAVAILSELHGPPVRPGQLWGVWAAEAPGRRVRAERRAGSTVLNGLKAWCSGAGRCTHALVTAHLEGGRRRLFAVALNDPGVHRHPGRWRNAGMRGSDTRTVEFSAVPAVAVGAPGDYLTRPGFWHGAIGVAACWLGGARAVAEALYRAAAGADDEHTLAHLGAVDAALAAADAMLARAAGHVDADPLNATGSAELWARRTRTVAETAADEAIRRSSRALGPGPLCHDETHAQAIADLSVYVRQSHAERDLAVLGRLAGSSHGT